MITNFYKNIYGYSNWQAKVIIIHFNCMKSYEWVYGNTIKSKIVGNCSSYAKLNKIKLLDRLQFLQNRLFTDIVYAFALSM